LEEVLNRPHHKPLLKEMLLLIKTYHLQPNLRLIKPKKSKILLPRITRLEIMKRHVKNTSK
jgi:hypothetical protein